MPSSAQPPIDFDTGSLSRRFGAVTAGAGTSLVILFVLAQMQHMEVEAPPEPIADLYTVVLEDPPPPPPEIATKEPPPPTVLDLEPLPSDNVIQIAVAPLTFEMPLPDAQPELEISLDAFRPDPKSGESNPNHVFQFREVDQTPVVVRRVTPEIPWDMARRLGDNNRVIFSMVVTKAGGVRSLSVVQTINPEVDRMVLEALSKWRFRPAIREGRPVNCLVLQSIIIKPPRGGSPFSI